MTNAAIDGVCKVLANEFGDEYRIYTEEVEQGFTEPCFFVGITDEELTHIRDNRYNLKISVDVIYSPVPGGGVRQDIYNKMLTLLDILEYIDADGEVKGEDIKGDVKYDADGLYLSVNATYQFTVYKEKEKSAVMEILKKEVGANG